MKGIGSHVVRGAALVAVAVLAVTHAVGVEASGSLESASTGGAQACPDVITDDGAGVHQNFNCTVAVSSNVLRVSPTVGALSITTTYPGATFPCGTASGSTVAVSVSYQDAFGTFSFSGNVPDSLSSVSGRCVSAYSALVSALPLSTATGVYAAMSEVCGFSISSDYGKSVDVDSAGTSGFRIDNAASTACTPSNS